MTLPGFRNIKLETQLYRVITKFNLALEKKGDDIITFFKGPIIDYLVRSVLEQNDFIEIYYKRIMKDNKEFTQQLIHYISTEFVRTCMFLRYLQSASELNRGLKVKRKIKKK